MPLRAQYSQKFSARLRCEWGRAGGGLARRAKVGIDGTALAFHSGPPQNSRDCDLHKSLGTLILLLTIIRLAWRWAHLAPALPDDIPVAQHRAAVAMHWGLYALLLVQTSIGWIGTAAYPAPVPFFGLFEFPQIWWEDRPLSDRLFALHFWIGILMAVLLVGHIGAALYHHFVRQDEVLRRMLWGEVAS